MKIRLVSAVQIAGFLLGGLVAVAGALALYVWVSFDADEAADVLSRYFQDNYRRALILGAPPELQVWPRPALLLHELSLAEPERNESFASIGELRIELAALPLIRRRFELQGLRIDDLTLNLRQHPTGEWNATDLLEPASAGLPADWTLKLDRLTLRDARVSIREIGRSEAAQISELELVAELPGVGTDGRAHWRGHLQDKASATELDFQGHTGLRLNDALRAAHLQALELEASGDGHGLRGATLQLKAGGLDWSALGERGELGGLEFRLRGARGTQSVDLGVSLPRLGWEKRALTGSKLSASLDLRTVDSHSELKLVAPELQAAAPNGSRGRDIRFEWRHQAGEGRSLTLQAGFEARLDLLADSFEASGLRGELLLTHPRLHEGKTRLALAGGFGWKDERLNLDTLASSDADQLRISAQLKKLIPLEGSFRLDSAGLDLDRFFASPADAQAGLGWPLPEDATLDGQLELARLKFGGLPIERLRGPLRVHDKALDSPALSATIHGGELLASLAFNRSNYQLATEGSFRALPVGRIALDTGLPVPLAGDAEGSFRLGMTLKPGQAVAPTLDGALRWSLAGASLRGIDLAAGLRELEPAISSGHMSARSPRGDEATELGSATSRFVFASGLLRTEQIQSTSKWLKLGGSGQADLRQGEIDFRLLAAVQPGAAKELAALGKKPLPLRIKGAAMHPDLRFEPGTKP